MDRCISCDVISGNIEPPGGIISEDRYWVVNHSVASPVIQMRGFLIIQLKRHCEHLADLTLEEIAAFGPILRNTCIALSRVLRPAKIYSCSFGETTQHVHFWIVPRSADMPADALQVLTRMINEKAWSCSEAEAAEVARLVRKELSQLIWG